MPVVGSSAYTTARTIAALARTFLNDIGPNGNPMALASISRSANVVTVVTQTPHGFVTGDYVAISGVSDPTFNGTQQITYVNSTTFTYPNTGANASPTGGIVAGKTDQNGVGLGSVFTDAFLIPSINSAYRKVQRALAMTGQTTFKVDDIYLTVAAVPTADVSVQTVINDATAPPNQLPQDLLEPLRLWERQSGSQDAFVEMEDTTNSGGLPSIQQGENLIYWEWREDGIWFVGSLVDVQIRLRYRKALPDCTDGTSTIAIRNAQDCIAYYTAALVAVTRGSPLAAQWDSAADDALENLVAGATRQQQRLGRRRKPYSMRQGARGWVF